jgi:hypothetical protein
VLALKNKTVIVALLAKGNIMQQLELKINRLSDDDLSAFGYRLPSMSKQQETRFGALMVKKAKSDKMLRDPGKGLPEATHPITIATALRYNAPYRDVALSLIAAFGKMTTGDLALNTGMSSKKAGSLLANLRKRNYITTTGTRETSGGGMPYEYTLTPHGKDLLKALKEKNNG